MSHRRIFQLSLLPIALLLALALITAAQTTVKHVPAKPTARSSGQEMFDAY